MTRSLNGKINYRASSRLRKITISLVYKELIFRFSCYKLKTTIFSIIILNAIKPKHFPGHPLSRSESIWVKFKSLCRGLMKHLLVVLIGLFSFLSAYAQPLSVDANTVALWNFNNDPSAEVVIDSTANNVVGSARGTALLAASPIGQGKARYFVDQYSVITFPVPSPGSALDLLNYASWSFEFSIFLDRPSPEATNIFNNGQIAIEIHDRKIAATVQRFSSQYGVKTVQQINLNTLNKIAVVYSNNEIGILVNGKVWASQSLDLNKNDKRNPLNVRLPVYLGGAPRETIIKGAFGKMYKIVINRIDYKLKLSDVRYMQYIKEIATDSIRFS